MRQRVSRRRRRRVQDAIAKSDEPPEPISLSTATLIAAGLGAATAISTPFINRAMQPKMPQLSAAPASPLAGESTKLKPGQKTNLINTGPQGLLAPASTGRQTLLGG